MQTNDVEHHQSLKLKRVAIDTNFENVVYLHKDCSIYRAEGFQALARIEIFTNDKKKMTRSLVFLQIFKH